MSCSPKLETQLIGKWEMQAVYDQGKDVSPEHNPANDRWVIFYKDKTFQSGGQPYGENSGKWEFNPKENILFLDSDAGEDDDSYWIINIEEKEMQWQGTKFEFAKRFKIVHERSEQVDRMP